MEEMLEIKPIVEFVLATSIVTTILYIIANKVFEKSDYGVLSWGVAIPLLLFFLQCDIHPLFALIFAMLITSEMMDSLEKKYGPLQKSDKDRESDAETLKPETEKKEK